MLRVIASFGVVFFHIYVAVGEEPSLHWLARLREFSVPVMVLMSFFLLASAIDRRGGCDVMTFVIRRVKRLWLPMIIWTTIYVMVVVFVIPFLFSLESTGAPPLSVFLTGYRHLWYLEFLFLSSIAFLPAILFIVPRLKDDETRSRYVSALFALALTLFVLFRAVPVADLLAEDADVNMHIFVSQSAANLPFIPVAVAIALIRTRISELLGKAGVYYWLVLLVATLGIVHSFSTAPFSKEFFAVSLFVAAIGPFSTRIGRSFPPLARYSYAIYILHFLPVHFVWIVCHIYGIEFGPGLILASTAGTVFVCVVSAFLLGRLPYSDIWLPAVNTSIDRCNKESSADTDIEVIPRYVNRNEILGLNTDVEVIRS